MKHLSELCTPGTIFNGVALMEEVWLEFCEGREASAIEVAIWFNWLGIPYQIQRYQGAGNLLSIKESTKTARDRIYEIVTEVPNRIRN